MPNLKPDHTSELDSETWARFLPSFLDQGWFLALDPERVLVGWGDAAEQSNAQLFAPDFFMPTPASAWISTKSCGIIERGELGRLIQTAVADDGVASQQFQWVEPSRQDFENQFTSIREGMRERGLAKAVPIVFAQAEAEITRARRLALLSNALQQPTHLFPYGFWNAEEGMIGVTPEILFSQNEENSFKTVALAGTRAKGQDEKANAEALMNDAKERHEHQLVIDDVSAVLKKMGHVQIAQTGVVFLPTLMHLKTEISVKLSEPRSFSQIVTALHPTPALGLSPRTLGFSEMHRWDSREDRRRYGAPFGVHFVDANGVEHRHCVVAIRNIQWWNSGQDSSSSSAAKILLGSGCGVVPASDLEREWQELQLKRNSVKRMLGV
jgi:isochorismate synthase EntC